MLIHAALLWGGVIYLYKYYLLGLKVYKNKSSSEQAFALYTAGMGLSIIKYILDELETSGLESPKIQNLCRGLDSQSKECIYRILSRHREAYYNQSNVCASLTNEEIETQRRLHTEFFPNICQLSEKLFYYNGYFFPVSPRAEVSVHWHKHNMENFKNLQKIKQKDIIDVGGFMGDSAVIFEDFTDKKIHTFEATKSNFTLLLETLKLNNATRVVPINKGLGSQKQTLSMHTNGACSTLCDDYIAFNKELKSEEVEIITLDSYVKENNIEVGFIKVDIEGFEQEFLKGAMETIKAQKPAMLISIYHNGADFFEIKPMIESWNLGYSFKIHKPLDFSISTETALYCEVLD